MALQLNSDQVLSKRDSENDKLSERKEEAKAETVHDSNDNVYK